MRKNEQCVYCLEHPTDANPLTKEHPFSESWYPTHTPPDLEKLVVPACRRCNEEKSRDDEVVFHALALCIEPDEEGYELIVREHLRAFDPSVARGFRDTVYRRAKLRKLKASMLGNPLLNPRRILPMTRNLQLEPGAVLVKADTRCLERFYRCLIKGITFRLFNARLVGPDATVKVDIRHEDEVMQDLKGGLVGKTSWRADWGPGLQVLFVAAEDERAWAVMYKVIIWERHYFHTCGSRGSPPRRQVGSRVQDNLIVGKPGVLAWLS